MEYAHKAVENEGTIIGLACKDGVVLGVEKLMRNKLLLPHSGRQIHSIDVHGKCFSSIVNFDCIGLIPRFVAGIAYTGYGKGALLC